MELSFQPQVLPLQEASYDTWDRKYRLKSQNGKNIDADVEGTFARIAKALSDVEPASSRKFWNSNFLWALQNGAIPAGRIVSNAGAKDENQ